ncbi:MAG: extracellular solute-binding protein, partial [Gaiellales bacterium]
MSTADKDREARDLAQRLTAGKISRRSFVKRATVLGLSVGSIGTILAACGGDDDDAAAPAPAEPAPAEPAPAEPAAPAGPSGAGDEVAIEALQQFSGTTLNVNWESGLQANDPKLVWGPQLEELTGVKINVIELDHGDLFTKAIAESIAGSGAFDILNIEPAWVPDLVAGNVIAPLDDWVAQYMPPADLEDYAPLYQTMATWQGKRYGLFDDGDVLILYYRKDLFDDNGIAVPTTWDEFVATEQMIRDEIEGVEGADFWRNPGFQHWPFLQHYRAIGGAPFDPATMDATLNHDLGVEVMQSLVAQNDAAAPGVLEHDPVTVLNAWLGGTVAMMFWWPPPGRWSAGLVAGQEGFDFVAESTVADKVGYAIMPNGHGHHASGFHVAVGADSPNQEAAYLVSQWITSPKVSLDRVTQPISLRDPYRISHFNSDLFRGLWADAGAYLDTLSTAADVAVTDFMVSGWQD